VVDAVVTMDDALLPDLSASVAVTAMGDGVLTAQRYALSLLDRAERMGALNAFITLNPDQVLAAAQERDRQRASGRRCGVLHGLPIPVKDSLNTAALPTSNGTRALKGFRPQQDAVVLTPLMARGAIVMGKTNLEELSVGWSSNNHEFGAVRNPYELQHSPGGSSGGSAAAVAARIAPLSVGEDTFGSVRVPASMCGIAGFRPTFGRYPASGIMAQTFDKFDQPAPMARSVGDLVLFDQVVADDFAPVVAADPRDIRVGIAPQFFLQRVDDDVEQITLTAVERLRAAGVTVVETDISEILAQALPTAVTIISYEAPAGMANYLAEQNTGVDTEGLLAQTGANTQAMFASLSIPPREVYEEALRTRVELRAVLQQYFADHNLDALMFPPTPTPAPRQGDHSFVEIGGVSVPIVVARGTNPAVGSVGGLASLVLPAGLTPAGLPVGMEFAAARGNDRRLLSIGLTLESMLGPIPAPQS
jgi:Asp-tRNA(Asn)/Glu-tRNA(Gln) amidotransferase A subunit family amidase